MTHSHPFAWGIASLTLLSLVACSSDDGDTPIDPPQASAPNILLVIMDDVGIDQMTSFGYGGPTAPVIPNMDAVAEAGLRFHNTWAMPVCSPGRAAIFAGRYPFRTGLVQPIGPDDLANSQLSPYEVTIPQVLKTAGYESAMFGKFHLAGPDHNQAGNATPAVLGWDYFYGWIGLPEAIDKRAGGIVESDAYSCGFVPGEAQGGAEVGACYYSDNTCEPMQRVAMHEDPPGLQCLDSGGIFAPKQSCSDPRPPMDFDRENAYYVSPLVIADQNSVEAVPYSDPRARGYRTRLEANAAIEWINARKGSDQPWMAAVTFTSVHTPLQTPPGDLLTQNRLSRVDTLDCSSVPAGRVIQNRMTEAMDVEFGRLLVETGLATRNDDGSLNYQPESTNTVIVIVADNGTLGYSVKQPFSPDRAKGTTYQTGVWVPLIIAGPQVEQPGRQVEHMVNQVDLFEFFGELAGIDVHEVVPRRVDSAPLLPYLTNPEQASIRNINFAMNGLGTQANGGAYGPCIITETLCSQIPTSKGVCEDNQGVWWGPGYEQNQGVVDNGGVGYLSCGEVNQALFLDQQPMVEIQPEQFMAIRNDNYKLVRYVSQNYDPATNTIGLVETEEFYRINQDVPVPLLDNADVMLSKPYPPDAQQAYQELHAKIEELLASEPACPGDGNRDGVVDAQDLANWSRIAQDWGLSSVYDFPVNGIYDGLTNHVDGAIIQQNMGLRCPPGPRIY